MEKNESEVEGKRPRNAYCSFCRKSYQDVGPLVEGPGDVYICGECIALCQSIINEEKRRRALSREQADAALMAASLGERLGQFLRGQEAAAQSLAVAAHRHLQRLNRTQDAPGGQMSAVLLVGAAESARLFVARCLAHVLGVPFAAVDRRTLMATAPSGFEGESFLHALLVSVQFDLEAAQRGLVYVDGIDEPDVARLLAERLAQTASSPWARRLNFDVSRPLLLLGGSFEGIDKLMIQPGRHHEQPIRTEDLRACGLPLDLARCVQTIVGVDLLDEETLARVVSCVDLARWPGRG